MKKIPTYDVKIERRGIFAWRWSVTTTKEGSIDMETYGSCWTYRRAHRVAHAMRNQYIIDAVAKAAA